MKRDDIQRAKGRVLGAVLPFLLFGLLMVNGFASFIVSETEQTEFPIRISNNTVQQVKFTPSDGIDSFAYTCTLVTIPSDSVDTLEIQYTGPVQTFWLKHTAAVDTTLTYFCSLAYKTDTVGFLFPVPEFETIDSILIGMMDSINDVAGMTDSFTADTTGGFNGDSIRIQADFGTISFGADNRPHLKISDSLAKGSTIVTVAMVVDTIVAIVNGNATLSAQMTAYDSNTFAFIVADTAGHAFGTLPGDTSVDTATVAASVNGASSHWDTIRVANLWSGNKYPKGCYVDLILRGTTDSSVGVGLSDSGGIWLQSAKRIAGNLVFRPLDSVKDNNLPCTLSYALTVDQSGSDSTLGEQLYIIYHYQDTASNADLNLLGTITIDAKVMQGN